MGVRPIGPCRHTLQMVLLEGHLPQERVEIVRFEGFDSLIEPEDFARGQPGDSQHRALLEESRLVCADTPTAARVPHDQLDQEHCD